MKKTYLNLFNTLFQKMAGSRLENKHLIYIKGISKKIYMEVHEERDTQVSAHIREHHIWEPDETTLIKTF
jgi:hypothetical protein